MEAHEKHKQDLIAAFADVVKAENRIAEIKGQLQKMETKFGLEIADEGMVLTAAWGVIEALLAETGEVSVLLPGDATDYEIYRTVAKESVKVADVMAVPDAFCKTERRPKLKEIGDYIRAQTRASLAAPNWATIELGESKLAWRAKKKTATKE